MKTKRVISIILPILFITSLMVPLLTMVSTTSTVSASNSWWNTSWTNRRMITISPLNPENFQIRINIPSDIAKSDYPSIRFLENQASATPLDYWIEQNDNNGTKVYENVAWVRRIENDDNTIWMYYGNAGASSAENGKNVFMEFSDFGDNANTNNWGTVIPGGASITWNNYNVQEVSTVGGNKTRLEFGEGQGVPVSEESTNRTIEFRMRDAVANRGGLVLDGSGWGDVEVACIFNGGSPDRFWQDGNYNSNAQDNKWYIGRVDMFGGSSGGTAQYTTTFYYGEDNGAYRQGSAVIGTKSKDWTRIDGPDYVDKYVLQTWDSSTTTYFDWFFVRKYASTEPVATFAVTKNNTACTAGTWTTRAAFIGVVNNSVMTTYAENNGIAYIYAFESGNWACMYRYNISANTWENLGPNTDHNTVGAGSGLVWDGIPGSIIYTDNGGGNGPDNQPDNFWAYSITNNTWTKKSPIIRSSSGSGLAYDPTSSDNDKVWALVGSSADTHSAIMKYSISGDTWTFVDNTRDNAGLLEYFGSGSSIVQVGDYLYLARGGGTGYIRYKIADNTWKNLENYVANFGAGGAQEKVSSDFIYATRGGGSNSTQTFARYQISTDNWVSLTDYPATRGNASDGLSYNGIDNLYFARATDSSFWSYQIGYNLLETIAPSSQTAFTGTTLSYTVNVKNTGTWSDTYNLTNGDNAGWTLGGIPATTGLLAPLATWTGTLTVVVGGSSGISDNVWVQATSQTDGTTDNESVLANNAVVGVTVVITPTDNQGAPGDNVKFNVTVTNTGALTDNFTLQTTDTLGWTLSGVPATTGAIAPLGSQSYTLGVIGPTTATDNITVKATSVGENTINNSAKCYAHVAQYGGTWEILTGTPWPGYTAVGVRAVYVKVGGNSYYYAMESPGTPGIVSLYRYNMTTPGWENLGRVFSGTWNIGTGGGLVWDGGDRLYFDNGGSGAGDNFGYYTISDNTYHQKANTLTKMSSGSNLLYDVAAADDYIWALGGNSATSQSWIEKYQISTDTWTIVDNTRDNTGALVYFGSGTGSVKVGQYIYLDRGGALTLYRYNTADNSWKQLQTRPFGGNNNAGTSGEKVGSDYIYWTVGGSGNPSNNFWRYTISTDNWVHLSDFGAQASNQDDRLVYDNSGALYLTRASNSDFMRYRIGSSALVTITPNTQVGWSGDTLAFSVTVTNTGSFDDNFNVQTGENTAWTMGSTLPANTGILAPLASVSGTVTVVVAGSHGDIDNIWVKATSVINSAISDNKSVLAKNAVPGVTVSITPTDNQGAPGDNVKFTVTVTNTGTGTDNFTIENTDNTGWLKSGLPAKIGPIASLGSQTYTLGVIIALPKDVDNIKVKATSTGDNTVNNSANCYAHEVLAVVSMSPITPNPKNGLPGDNLTWTVTVFNQWSTADNIAVTVNDPLWGVGYVDNAILTIPAFDNRTTILHENIPISAQGKQSNTITVTATSGNDSSVSASRSVTVNVTFVAGVNVTVTPSPQNGWTGDNLVYNFTVTNTGNGPDTFLVNFSDDAAWPKGTSTLLSADTGGSILVSQDTYSTSNAPDNNWALYSYDRAGPRFQDNINYGDEWAYMKFPLSSLPAGAKITSATLYVRNFYHIEYWENGSYFNDNAWFEAWSNDNDNWNENTLTWNNQPLLNGAMLDNKWVGPIGWDNWNVTSFVANHFALGNQNVTMVLRSNGIGDDSHPNCFIMFDGHRDVGYQSQWPYLQITYVVPQSLAKGASLSGTAWTIVSGPMSTVDNLHLVATSVTDNTVSDDGLFQAHSADGAVAITIEPSTENGLPGDMENYTVTVTNNGQLTDNLLIVNLGDTQGWTTSLDNTLFSNVPVGENRSTTLRVTIPGGAIGGTVDNITLMAVEQGAGQTSQTSCTTDVTVVRGVTVLISPDNQGGNDGATLTYTVTVTNTGDVSDNYSLTPSDDAGWSPSVLPTSVVVPAFSSDSTTTLSVTISPSAIPGTIDNITVTANGTGDSASDNCTAEATGVTFSINLVAGWNLVCFPVTGENNTPENIFAGLTDFVDYSIYSWTAPGGPYNLIGPTDVLQDNIGYWIYMASTHTITWTGTQPTSRVENLVAGWNMAGFPIDNASTTAGNTFAPLTYFTDVYLYSWTAPGGPYNAIGPSDVLVDNTGYWVFLDTNKTITVPN